MDAPLATERRSLLPTRLRSTTIVGSNSRTILDKTNTPVSTNVDASNITTTMKFQLNDRVLVSGIKLGTIRYIGKVKFTDGIFCGIELDEAEGKHDGKVNEVRYFQCRSKHGVFVPIDKVTLFPRERSSSTHRNMSRMKPATVKRSMTMSTSMHRFEPIRSTKTMNSSSQLPDIVPDRSISPKEMKLNAQNRSDNPNFLKPVENRNLNAEDSTDIPTLDFADSVYMVLHKLQESRSDPIADEEEDNEDEEDDCSEVSSVIESVDSIPTSQSLTNKKKSSSVFNRIFTSVKPNFISLNNSNRKDSTKVNKNKTISVNTNQSDLNLTQRGKNRSVDEHHLESLEQQSIMDKKLIRTLAENETRSRKQNEFLQSRLELFSVLIENFVKKNDALEERIQKLAQRYRDEQNRWKRIVDENEEKHRDETIRQKTHYQNEIIQQKQNFQKKITENRETMEEISKRKVELEQRCKMLEERIEMFNEEMAKSEHADLLLTHVEKLEKDRTSLQTVLELKNLEVTQLRAKINEQTFQREDQMAMQRRIDLVENRNQDLVCLLRQWQLNEKSVVVQRDEMKERINQLERENQQLTFENEILVYRLHRSSSLVPKGRKFDSKMRRRSFSCLSSARIEVRSIRRSSSFENVCFRNGKSMTSGSKVEICP